MPPVAQAHGDACAQVSGGISSLSISHNGKAVLVACSSCIRSIAIDSDHHFASPNELPRIPIDQATSSLVRYDTMRAGVYTAGCFATDRPFQSAPA